MCDKLPYNNPRIDKCLLEIVKKINEEGQYRTIASCCGHGKYNKTIIVKEKKSGKILEYFTKMEILTPKKRNRYYKKDWEGFYYVPELKAILFGTYYNLKI